MSLLMSDNLEFQNVLIEELVRKHITLMNIFGKHYNQGAPKKPLKVKNAQSMMQVMYKDFSKYQECDINDLEP